MKSKNPVSIVLNGSEKEYSSEDILSTFFKNIAESVEKSLGNKVAKFEIN